MPTRAHALEPLEAYADLLGAEAVHQLRKLAEPLRGARILHISITTSDTHNARALSATVPLLQDLGLEVGVAVPAQTREFEEFSAPLLAAIQGDDQAWIPEFERAWRRFISDCASEFDSQADLVSRSRPAFLTAARGSVIATYRAQPLAVALSSRPSRL